MTRWKLWLSLVLVIFLAACGTSSRRVVSVTISPTNISLTIRQSLQFTASVGGTDNTNVTWFVNDVQGGNTTVGTISATGFYTAPDAVPSPRDVTIKATSAADPAVSGTTTVTILSGVTVTVTPMAATIGTSETFQFTATVAGTTNTMVTWSVNDVMGGNSTLGTIDTTGLYTAPAALPSPPNVSIRATSVADTTVLGSAAAFLMTAMTPTLTAINPTRVAQGSLFEDVYLVGTNFLSTTIVRVNGTPVASRLLGPALLVTRIPSGLLQNAGMLPIDVQAQGGMASPSIDLTVEAVRPALVGTTPDSATQGGAAVSVSFNGGFYSPSISASFNGLPVAPTVNSSRQLDVPLGPAQLSTAGLFAVTVRNPAATPPLVGANLAVQPSALPSVLTTLAVGAQPSAVAVNTATGVAVVANRGDNTISRIDLNTNMLLGAPIAVGMTPTGVAVDQERNIALVANNSSNTISVVDLAGGMVVATIASPNAPGTMTPLKPFSVGVNPLSGIAVVANQSASAVTLIDVNTNMVLGTVGTATIPVTTGTNPQVAIEPRLDWAIITPGGTGPTTIVDLARRSVVATVAFGPNMRGVSVNRETQRALLADPTGTTVTLFSVLDQTVNNLILEAGHVATAVNLLTDVGVTANPTTDMVSILDLRTPLRTTQLAAGTDPVAVAIDPGSNQAVVANEGSNNVTIIGLGAIRSPHIVQSNPLTTLTSGTDLTLTVTGFGFQMGAEVRLDEVPVATVFNSSRRLTATVPAAMLSGPRRYMVDVQNPGMVLSNITDLTVMQAVSVGTTPRAVAIDPERELAVVTNNGSNDVSLVDLTTGMVTTVAVGTSPEGVAVNSRVNRAAVANRGSNNVSLIDLDMAMEVNKVTVGGEPIGVVIDPDGGSVIVANSTTNNLSVFDSVSAGTPTSIPTDLRPVALAVDSARGRVGVVNSGQNTMQLIDFINAATLARVQNLQLPTGIVYDQVSDRYIVVASLSNNLAVIDPSTFQVTPVRVGINPTSLAYNVQTSTLVTVNSASQTVSVMDFLDRRVRAVIPLAGSSQFSVAIHPRTNLAVVVDEAGNRVLLVPLPR